MYIDNINISCPIIKGKKIMVINKIGNIENE